MESITVIVLFIQLALLFYFFVLLSLITRNTDRIAKSANGSFLLKLFTKFNEDARLVKVHQVLKLPPDNQNVTNLIANEIQDLFYYLNFLEFVAALEGRKLETDEMHLLFGKQFDNLLKHPTLYDNIIATKYPQTERLSRFFFLQERNK